MVRSKSSSRRRSLLLLNFLPALLVWPVWLTIGLRYEQSFKIAFVEYWPMMVAMIVGSMIAGSTPLGGGVVAFPVAVLVLGLTPTQGRDFSLFIQSVGLSAATYLIFTRKQQLLKGLYNLLAISCFFSVLGVIIGFQLTISPFIVNLVYTTTVASFAIILSYVNYINNNNNKNNNSSSSDSSSSLHFDSGDSDGDDGDSNNTSNKSSTKPQLKEGFETFDTYTVPFYSSSDSSSSSNNNGNDNDNDNDDIECSGRQGDEETTTDGDNSSNDEVEEQEEINSNDNDDIVPMNICTFIAVTISGILGGILSSQIGSGADITFYVLGSVYLNNNNTRRRQNNKNNKTTDDTTNIIISANSLTAVSVIIMATTSVFGTILRVTTFGSNAPTTETYQLWLSCAWIVVVGAPVGSLFLTPNFQEHLKCLFYVLALLQLIIFGALKIQTNGRAWAGVAGTISATILFVFVHYYRQYIIIVRKNKEKKKKNTTPPTTTGRRRANS